MLCGLLRLVLAVAVYGERLGRLEWAAFGLIWLALALYATASLRGGRSATQA